MTGSLLTVAYVTVPVTVTPNGAAHVAVKSGEDEP